MATETVKGRQFIIHFDASRCIHSRHCVLDRPDVFVPNVQGEWIYPDRADAEAVSRLAFNCPSGAITFERVDGGVAEAPPVVNTVRVRENGPLAFHADLKIGEGAPELRATLCRCGLSKNKPYCDNSHGAGGFQATGEPPTQESQPLAARNGVVQVTPTQDGPLKVTGNLELVSGTGRTINRVTEAWLCRCGHSQKKPYCDGSHKKVGFRSE